MRHPAKFSDSILPIIDDMLGDAHPILDPFAGVGKLREIRSNCVLSEIEWEWLKQGETPCVLSDALSMPFVASSFAAIATSPVYGNRVSDCFVDGKPEKKYVRNTYTHAIGRKLHDNNAGKLQWGQKYREFHRRAWGECARVLKDDGVLVLNISDHIRKNKKVHVMSWHISALLSLGFVVDELVPVSTKRNRFGQNRDARVDWEYVIRFVKEQ